jgi:hypothetical protein
MGQLCHVNRNIQYGGPLLWKRECTLDLLQRSSATTLLRMSGRLDESAPWVCRTIHYGLYPYHFATCAGSSTWWLRSLYPILPLDACTLRVLYCILFSDDGMELTTHEVPTPDPPVVVIVILSGLLKSPSSIWIFDVFWIQSVDLNLHSGSAFECFRLMHLHFLMNKLQFITEDVPRETRLKMLFHLDGAPPQFGRPSYGWLESALWESMDWSCWFSDLATEISGPNFVLFIYMGSYQSDCLQDEGTGEGGTLWRIMNAAACIWEYPEMMQRPINLCLGLANFCIENCGGHFQYLTYDALRKIYQ